MPLHLKHNYHILSERIHPDDLKIGQIVSDPKVIIIVNTDEVFDFDTTRIRHLEHSNLTLTQKEASTCIFAGEALGIISGHARSSNASSHKFVIAKMHEKHVKFDQADYLNAVHCSPQVQKHLAKFGSRVFIVTGLLICNETFLSLQEGATLTTHGGVAADGDLAGVGVGAGAGAGAGASMQGGWSQQVTVQGELVFAVRLTKLRYKKIYMAFGELKLSAKSYHYGAALVGSENSKTADTDATFEVEVESESEEEEGEELPGAQIVVNWAVPKA